MAEVRLLPSDVVEQILVRSDVKDLIRYTSVCKSWHSFISSPFFVKAHLNHSYNNDRNTREFGHRRISNIVLSVDSKRDYIYSNSLRVIGSFNGLVCVSPRDVQFVVTNPCTRQHKKLPTPGYRPDMSKVPVIRDVVCWGFGYDSSADDYKVIAGFRKTSFSRRTRFFVLSLKSNTWMLIGRVNYECLDGIEGILCGEALHWFMNDKKKKVIISLDLTTHKFKEIPQPINEEYECHVDDELRLGVIQEYLCIYSSYSPLSSNIWVMKDNKWELYNDDHWKTKYDVTHHVVDTVDSQNTTSVVYSVSDHKHVPSVGHSMRGSIFVKSLVSPHIHFNNYEGQNRNAKAMQQQQEPEGIAYGDKGNIRKRTRRKRSFICKHIKPFLWIQ